MLQLGAGERGRRGGAEQERREWAETEVQEERGMEGGRTEGELLTAATISPSIFIILPFSVPVSLFNQWKEGTACWLVATNPKPNPVMCWVENLI